MQVVCDAWKMRAKAFIESFLKKQSSAANVFLKWKEWLSSDLGSCLDLLRSSSFDEHRHGSLRARAILRIFARFTSNTRRTCLATWSWWAVDTCLKLWSTFYNWVIIFVIDYKYTAYAQYTIFACFISISNALNDWRLQVGLVRRERLVDRVVLVVLVRLSVLVGLAVLGVLVVLCGQ